MSQTRILLVRVMSLLRMAMSLSNRVMQIVRGINAHVAGVVGVDAEQM
jgi:hypothetical protein